MPRKNKPIFKTYDEFVIDKLREIEPATIKQIANALGIKNSNSIWRMLKRMCGEERIYVDITNKPYIYRVKEVKVSYD